MRLAELKRHPSYPFVNFESDDLSFLLLELYWAELFRSALASSEDAPRTGWAPRLAAQRDGNPILSVINRDVSPPRALRVIQRFNSTGLPALDLETFKPTLTRDNDAYVAFVPDLDRNSLDDDGETPIEGMVISSDVSPQCERLFALLVRAWCVEMRDVQEIQRKLDAYWARVREALGTAS